VAGNYVQTVGDMEDRSPPPSLNYSLDSLPKGLIGGYNRRATEQLFRRLSATYKNVLTDQARLHDRVRELEATVVQSADAEQQLTGELNQLKAELASSRQRESTLAEGDKHTKAQLEEEFARVRAQLETELQSVRTQLASHEKRELLVEKLLEAAKRSTERIRQEARDEGNTILKKAREHEAQIIRDGERESKRLEADKERLTAIAAKLRTDLSITLMTTLDQLKSEQETPGTARSKSETSTGTANDANGGKASRSQPARGERKEAGGRPASTKR
jgi:cell division septum initiation protein DivIVA